MEAGPPSEPRAVSARTLQGMARVRSGHPVWPLVSDRRAEADGRAPRPGGSLTTLLHLVQPPIDLLVERLASAYHE